MRRSIVTVIVIVHGSDQKVLVKATTSRNGCLALVGLEVVVVRPASAVDRESVETAELRGRVERVGVENRE